MWLQHHVQQQPENMPDGIFIWSRQKTLLRWSVKGGRREEGDLKEAWRCGDLTVVAGRKPYLVSLGGGMV